jgi:hypothetical protein
MVQIIKYVVFFSGYSIDSTFISFFSHRKIVSGSDKQVLVTNVDALYLQTSGKSSFATFGSASADLTLN